MRAALNYLSKFYLTPCKLEHNAMLTGAEQLAAKRPRERSERCSAFCYAMSL